MKRKSNFLREKKHENFSRETTKKEKKFKVSAKIYFERILCQEIIFIRILMFSELFKKWKKWKV